MRSTSAGDSLETLAVPARWPLISTSTWLLKSRPWPSVEAPRMLIEVCPAVHSLMKPTEFSASRSVTDLADEWAMRSCGMTWMVPAILATSSGRPVAVTTVSCIRYAGAGVWAVFGWTVTVWAVPAWAVFVWPLIASAVFIWPMTVWIVFVWLGFG